MHKMHSPMLIATLQAAALSTASNLFAQHLLAYQEKRSASLDLLQLLRFVALTLITAPPNYYWQQLLERIFPGYPPDRRVGRFGDVEMKGGQIAPELKEGRSRRTRGSGHGTPKFSKRNMLAKWFVDCISVGAIVNTVAFLFIMGILKGQSGSQIWHNVKTQTVPIIVAGYKIWPLASVISFGFIPVHRRIVFLSFVGLIWGVYLSLVAFKV
ncbi:hypothetical protein G7046_g3188 [Stylonectria norvegica]|nr:hypothetical protein G7046_g3188 [Stylonectria norvegica]